MTQAPFSVVAEKLSFQAPVLGTTPVVDFAGVLLRSSPPFLKPA
jgi:hypothetical protein